MIRIAGILCGSALAIALLLIAVGVPKFSSVETADHGTALTAELPPKAPAEPIIQPIVGPKTNPIKETVEDTNGEALEAQEQQVAPEPEIVAEDVLVEPLPDATPTQQADIENWFAFWSPFRSELAANGFVSQLQRSTGMDYRVVKVKTGIYEVAFAYDDDADIENKLAAISAATGLEMPDG